MKSKKPISKIKKTRLMARVDAGELETIFKKAFVFCKGNMSEYLREAALNYERKKTK